MSNAELNVSRGEGASPAEVLKAFIEAQLSAALEKKMLTRGELELTQSPWPNEWEVFAWGPYQWKGGVFDPYYDPGRIIFTSEKAYVGIAVWMNPLMCADITGHEDKIELSIWTSDMQRMKAVNDLSQVCCIHTKQFGPCFYVTAWEFTPTEDACLYETNICARICNCQGHTLPEYAGFVRHVYDFDPEKLWPPGPPPTPGWGFDRPIRYMVANAQSDCDCTKECGPLPSGDPSPY
jgi:hypothetical protein